MASSSRRHRTLIEDLSRKSSVPRAVHPPWDILGAVGGQAAISVGQRPSAARWIAIRRGPIRVLYWATCVGGLVLAMQRARDPPHALARAWFLEFDLVVSPHGLGQ